MKWNKSPRLWDIRRRHMLNFTEFYRLPQDMYQTAKVAKILLLLEQGKGEKFKGKNLNEIEIENEIYYSSESDNDEEPLINKVLRKAAHTETSNITQ
ncbi:hypothetical protein QE152_g13441 [Popillia japonica]|uniref:Uncharacterized protein n=1 Tax=Popillia japonica TaxID=7064 RepID=A0AAW1LDR3_POPJA